MCLDVHAKRRGLLPSSQGKASKDDTVAPQKADKGGHHMTGDKEGRGGTETPSPSGKRLVNLKVRMVSNAKGLVHLNLTFLQTSTV